MKVLLILLVIIIISYFLIRNISPFGAPGVNLYPSPLPGPVVPSQLSSWTSINEIPYDNTPLVYDKTNNTAVTINCYNMRADTTLDTTSTARALENQWDATIVNHYLTFDTYAGSFMNNSTSVMVPTTIIDVSRYNIGGSTTSLSTTKFRTVNGVKKDYYYLSWSTANDLKSVTLKPGLTGVGVDTSTIKKIKASVLYSLINLYYNPGSDFYTGLVYDFSTNYPVGDTTSSSNTPNASTKNIRFTMTSKHAVWIYLLARAQWINTKITEL